MIRNLIKLLKFRFNPSFTKPYYQKYKINYLNLVMILMPL